MSELYGDWSIIANGKPVSDIINDLLLSTLTKEKKKPEKNP